MAEKVLLVDDEENVLHGYHRVLHRQFELEVAMGGAPGAPGPGAARPVRGDRRGHAHAGHDRAGPAAEAQELAPDTTRIMLTGNLDQKTAMDAVNQGQVFRFLTKPCGAERPGRGHPGGARASTSWWWPSRNCWSRPSWAASRCSPTCCPTWTPSGSAGAACCGTGPRPWPGPWASSPEWDLETAALLLPIGRIALPPELLAKLQSGAPLDPRERTLLDRAPETGARILANIPRLRQVSEHRPLPRQGL